MKIRIFLSAVVVTAGLAAALFFLPPKTKVRLAAASPLPRTIVPTAAPTDWDDRIRKTGPKDFAATMEDALSIADPKERQRILSALATKWLDTDRMTFVAFLEEVEVDDSTEGTDKWDRLIPALRDAFGRVDENAAASPVLNDAIQKFVEIYAGKDAQAALAWVEASLLGDSRDQAMETIIAQTAIANPEGAQALLATIKQPYRRVEGIRDVAAGLGENNPSAAYAWAGRQKAGIERTLAMQSALTAIAKKQPQQAAQYFEQFQIGVDAEAAAALAKVPADSPAATKRSFSAEDDGEAQMSPTQAIEAHRRDQLDRMADTIAVIAENWAAIDPAAAQSWAAEMPEGRLRVEAVNAALVGAAAQNPAAAFAAYRSTPNATPETANAIFQAWAVTDPAEATSLVDSIPDGTARAAAVGGIVTGWSGTDNGDPDAWVEKLPAGAERDAGLASLSASLADDDPQAAWQKGAEIQNAAQREAALSDAFAAIIENDPDAARSLLTSTNINADTRKKLQRDLDGATLTTRPKN